LIRSSYRATIAATSALDGGCGNSALSVDMYSDGFHNILNVDYCDVVISEMRERHKTLDGMTWAVMDIRDMSRLDSESFDVVIEKGTLDSLLVDEKDSWHVSEEAESMIDTILSEVSRVLRPGGRFISVTFAQPHFRIPMLALERLNWDVRTDVLGSHFHYFYFTMTKGQKLSEHNSQMRDAYLRRKSKKYLIVSVSDSEDEDYLLKSVFVGDDDTEN